MPDLTAARLDEIEDAARTVDATAALEVIAALRRAEAELAALRGLHADGCLQTVQTLREQGEAVQAFYDELRARWLAVDELLRVCERVAAPGRAIVEVHFIREAWATRKVPDMTAGKKVGQTEKAAT